MKQAHSKLQLAFFLVPPRPNQTNSLSMAICRDWIWGLSCEPSFIVTEVAITGRDTPHARPKACLERTNTYGTFLSSHSSGKWRMISNGSASAAITMNSEIPRLRVLVAERKRKKRWINTTYGLPLKFNPVTSYLAKAVAFSVLNFSSGFPLVVWEPFHNILTTFSFG